jgi:hypothetical protein
MEVCNLNHYLFHAPWNRFLLEKLTGSQLIKRFPAFYETRRYITSFTKARQLSLWKFRNMIRFDGEELLALHPNPKLVDQPLAAVRDVPHWRPFLHPQPEDASCRVDRLALIKVESVGLILNPGYMGGFLSLDAKSKVTSVRWFITPILQRILSILWSIIYIHYVSGACYIAIYFNLTKILCVRLCFVFDIGRAVGNENFKYQTPLNNRAVWHLLNRMLMWRKYFWAIFNAVHTCFVNQSIEKNVRLKNGIR